MKLRWKIFLGFSLLILATLLWGLNLSHQQLRPRYLEAIEDTLFDVSNYYGHLLETRGLDSHGKVDSQLVANLLARPTNISVPAQIYQKTKDKVELRIYVTNQKGVVVFDSEMPEEIGKDYSRWIDVRRTLAGHYGARATRIEPDDPLSSTLIVAAPIRYKGRVVGVVSVGKPLESLRTFFARAEFKFFQGLALLITLSLLITFFISRNTLRSLDKLSRYVSSLGGKTPVAFPELGSPEIRELGARFLEMKNRLEGREYVERYVTSLTHEIKSPLSGILGAAELITSKELSVVDRDRLLKNIREEALRLKDVSEQILELASLEKRSRPLKSETFDLVAVIEEIEESLSSQMMKRDVKIEHQTPDECLVRGERFLVWRAIYNLVQNALEFSPEGATVQIKIRLSADGTAPQALLEIIDSGPGLPDFVRERLFEKFFSTERPSTGKRGVGLGLTFVKEVFEQHGGSVKLENRGDTTGTHAFAKIRIATR